MNLFFVAARALHYASAMLVFGELVSLVAVAPSAWRGAAATAANGDVARRFFAVVFAGIIVVIASGIAWFVAEAAVMSGLPLAAAMSRDNLTLVLGSTLFGHVWALRGGLVVALSLLLIAMRRWSIGRPALALAALLVAALFLLTLACAGHAVAAEGSEDRFQMGADIAHLLAGGAWLGALPALAFLLRDAQPHAVVATAARRFSWLGLACVAALIASGLVNAWYQVGNIPALVGTRYGHLLIAKLILFAAMLAIAGANRGFLTQRLYAGDRGAQRSLRRNAFIEVALGLGVIAIVGALGVTAPAAHEPVVWPFAHTLSFLPMQQSAWIQLTLAAAAIIGCVALIAALADLLRRPPRVRVGTIAALLIPVGAFVWLLVVPAVPTTYLASPAAYATASIARGALQYSTHCIECHGADGRGGASVPAGANAVPDLTDRVPERREGELYWSIAHGVTGTAMPGFASRLRDGEIWNLIELLDAQTAARNAIAMTDRVKPLRPVAAPEFTFDRIGRAQESLTAERGDRVTVLVFYTLPQSLERLEDLAARRRSYAAAGARVIALPMEPPSIAPTLAIDSSILADAGDDVASTFRMFEGPAEPGSAPTHVEYLMDRNGYLRVRWIGVPEVAAERGAAMLQQIEILYREPPRPLVEWGHRH